MNGLFRLGALSIFLFLLAPGVLFSQETRRYLATAAEAKPYASIASRLEAYGDSVRSAGVAERLYLDRLREGVRKGAAVELLDKAMAEEASRLVFMAGALDAGGFTAAAEVRERVLSDGALALRASVSREEFSAAVHRIGAKGLPAGRVSAVVLTLAAIDPARVLGDQARGDLVAAIAGSVIRTDRLDSLEAVFARGRSFGMDMEKIARLVTSELDAGRGLSAVDGALERERRSR